MTFFAALTIAIISVTLGVLVGKYCPRTEVHLGHSYDEQDQPLPFDDSVALQSHMFGVLDELDGVPAKAKLDDWLELPDEDSYAWPRLHLVEDSATLQWYGDSIELNHSRRHEDQAITLANEDRR